MVEPARPAITVSRKGRLPKVDAAVEGPLFMLLALMVFITYQDIFNPIIPR